MLKLIEAPRFFHLEGSLQGNVSFHVLLVDYLAKLSLERLRKSTSLPWYANASIGLKIPQCFKAVFKLIS